MTERQLREQEFQIARYRHLEREVTDPLAACLFTASSKNLKPSCGGIRLIGRRRAINAFLALMMRIVAWGHQRRWLPC